MDLKEHIFGFLLVALFLVSTFTFVFSFTAENKPVDFDTDEINLAGLEAKLMESKEDSEDYMLSFQSENPLVSFGSLILFSVVGIGKLVINSFSAIYEIVIGGISGVLGIPTMVTGVLTAIILLSLIFSTWKLIKTGK